MAATFGPFAARRIHSLAGLWFLLFLIEHLFTNSQAALWVGESGEGFIRAVNFIHNLPYLTVIEIVLLGIPIATHAAIGIKYAVQAKMNSFPSDGTKPSLKEYGRNRAYSWQRITSYFLLFMLIFHVAKFRFIEYPKHAVVNAVDHYLVKVSFDPGIYTVAARLKSTLYDEATLIAKLENLSEDQDVHGFEMARKHFQGNSDAYSTQVEAVSKEAQFQSQELNYKKTLASFSLTSSELIADCPDFGTASIFSVRDTFKSKIYGVIYSLFVLAAVFHGSNGFWTFCLTWGLIFKKAAQKSMILFSLALMLLLGFLGLAAIWGTYFVTLKS